MSSQTSKSSKTTTLSDSLKVPTTDDVSVKVAVVLLETVTSPPPSATKSDAPKKSSLVKLSLS